MVDFIAASVNTFAAPEVESVPTGEVVPTRGGTLLDLDGSPSGSIPLPVEACDINTIVRAVSDLTCEGSLSHPSVSHAVNIFSLTRSDEDRRLVAAQGPTSYSMPGSPLQLCRSSRAW